MILLLSQSHRVSSSPRVGGFTLLEVILAIVIALGILLVLLYFYEQATTVRTQAIQQTEEIAAARLFMDRFTGELRTAQPQGFNGTSNTIQFVKADVPSFASWNGGALGRSSSPVTDLKLVRYELEALDGTNIDGLLRTEEPLVLKRQLGSEDDATGTNAVQAANPLPLIAEIRFLQLRYWAGTNWQDNWNSRDLPEAVEINVGPQALTNETDLAEVSADLFHRVIYLPTSRVQPAVSALPSFQKDSNSAAEAFP